MNRIAVYGSLRRKCYNYERCLKGYEPVGTIIEWGYEMLDLGSYPAIIKGKGEVFFEIYEVDEHIAIGIERMELGAGYTPASMHTDWGDAVFYVMENKPERATEVKGGDWVKYLINKSKSARIYGALTEE